MRARLDLAAGAPDQATAHAEQAFAIHHETGDRLGQARTSLVLGHARRQAGDHDKARRHWRHAHALFTEIGAPEAAEAAALLAD